MESLKDRLRKGESLLGTMITLFDNPDIVRILKVCGFDYFIIDCEHSGFDYQKTAALLSMAKAVNIGGFVRIPEVNREAVLKYLDMGAAGLLLPNCDKPEQARLLVEYSKYYPMGNRGVSLLRAHSEYAPVDSAIDYMAKTNRETILMIQIESPAAVSNIDEMLSVDGIDVAFVGPNDLSQSMGIMGQFQAPEFISNIDRVITSAKACGKYSGIHLTDTEALSLWIQKGMSMNLWSSDTKMIMDAARTGLVHLKR